jgi:hydrocephalus-inducing protein
VFVQSESLFDFGPLLVGKNSSDKVSHRNVNSSTFRISNQGKFDADIKFALLSTVIEDAEQKKGIFQLEQEGTPLGLNSLPFELRIWAFPDAP